MKALVAIKRDKTFDTFFTKDNIDYANSLGEIVWLDTLTASPDELKEKIKDCDAYITCWGSPALTPELLDSAPNLKLLTHLGSSVAPVATPAVFERGIKVISGFDYFSKSTAEGVIAYMLAALRDIPFFNDRLKNKKIWHEENDYTDSVLYKNIGIVGFGGVAKYVVKMLQNFDVNIKVYNRSEIPADVKNQYGITQCPIDEVFSTCDIISLHLPYNDGTHHMIDERLLSLIKPGALFVNTARGAIVDEDAMTRHLEKGDFNAALDVYGKEPIDMSSPLLDLDNVLMLPHQAGVTVNLRSLLTRDLIKETADFIDNGAPLKNEILGAKAKNMSKS